MKLASLGIHIAAAQVPLFVHLSVPSGAQFDVVPWASVGPAPEPGAIVVGVRLGSCRFADPVQAEPDDVRAQCQGEH